MIPFAARRANVWEERLEGWFPDPQATSLQQRPRQPDRPMRVVETTRDLERSSEHGQFPVVIPAGTLGWITQQGDGTSLQAPIRLGEATVLVRVPDPPRGRPSPRRQSPGATALGAAMARLVHEHRSLLCPWASSQRLRRLRGFFSSHQRSWMGPRGHTEFLQ